MVNELVIAAMPLLIQNALEAFQYTQAIFKFTILAQYISYDNKTLQCIEHVLYIFEKTKILFEYHQSFHAKLCNQPSTTLSYIRLGTLFSASGIIIVL